MSGYYSGKDGLIKERRNGSVFCIARKYCLRSMKGYYSLGLTGYEVDVIDQDHVRWVFVGTDREQIAHRARIYHTAGGRAYFNANGRRIHLDECLRTNI